MSREERLQHIKENPQAHSHTYEGLVACCTTADGAVDLGLIEAHEGIHGSNGGRRCDVKRGPCACGAWH